MVWCKFTMTFNILFTAPHAYFDPRAVTCVRGIQLHPADWAAGPVTRALVQALQRRDVKAIIGTTPRADQDLNRFPGFTAYQNVAKTCWDVPDNQRWDAVYTALRTPPPSKLVLDIHSFPSVYRTRHGQPWDQYTFVIFYRRQDARAVAAARSLYGFLRNRGVGDQVLLDDRAADANYVITEAAQLGHTALLLEWNERILQGGERDWRQGRKSIRPQYKKIIEFVAEWVDQIKQ
jgi:hypothetical protein